MAAMKSVWETWLPIFRQSTRYPTSPRPPAPPIWGAYGLITALSSLTGHNLLPDPQAEVALIRQAVDAGAVDGTTAARTYTVDGFDLEANAAVLEQLHRLLAQQPDCSTEC